jgi:hypothetical protein
MTRFALFSMQRKGYGGRLELNRDPNWLGRKGGKEG